MFSTAVGTLLSEVDVSTPITKGVAGAGSASSSASAAVETKRTVTGADGKRKTYHVGTGQTYRRDHMEIEAPVQHGLGDPAAFAAVGCSRCVWLVQCATGTQLSGYATTRCGDT